MPTLSIDIEARFSRFQDGLDKIGRDVERSTARMTKSFGALKNVAAGFIGAFAGIAGIHVFKSLIDDLDKLHTVSQRTGVSAEKLVGLALAAKQTGTDFETAAKGLNKINIALSDLATGKSAELKDLLTQLGLPQFAKGAIDAEEAMLQLAEVFPRLSAADQARVALDLLGKSGQELIPLFADGRKPLEAFFRIGRDNASGINELAKAADEFNDAMTKLAFGIKAALLPVLQALVPLFTALSEGIYSAKQAGTGFYEILPFEKSRAQIALLRKDLEGLRKQQADFESGKASGKGFVGTLNKAFNGSIGDASQIIPIKERQLAELEKRVNEREADEARARNVKDSPLKLRPPPAKTKGGSRAVDRDDSAKRLLDQQIKAFERSIDEERDLAQTRNDFLQRFYDEGLVSLGDYTRARGAILEEAANKQKLALGSEIALLQASKKGKAKDDVIAIDTKINDLMEKQADLNRDLKLSQADLFYDKAKEAQEFADALQRVNIEALRSKGDFEGAFRLEFSLNNREQLKKFETEAKNAATPQERRAAELGKERVNSLRDEGILKEKLAKFEGEANILRNNAADAEERINLAIQQGTTGTLEGGQQINALRERTSFLLTEQFQKMESIAKLSTDPAMAEAIKGWNIELERLNANLDPLRDKMEDLVTGGFSDFFDKLISGTVSAKDAFRSLFKDILGGLAKMGKDDFLKQIFAKGGSLGGVADTLAGSGKQGGQQAQGGQLSGGGILSFFSGLGKRKDTQAAAPISEGVASSFGASAQAGAGAEAALALKDVATSSTVTSFALKEFADDGVAGATQQLFENVATGAIEQTAAQTATGAMAGLTVAANLAASALSAIAAQKAIGSVASAAAAGSGGFAQGGQVTGAGSGTSDSIPVLLSNKEFVIRAKPVQEPGALAFLTRFNKMGMKAMQRYSLGGLVGASMGMSPGTLMAAGGGVNVTQNFTVAQNTPRETQQQIASAAYQGGVRAFRRNR